MCIPDSLCENTIKYFIEDLRFNVFKNFELKTINKPKLPNKLLKITTVLYGK